MTSASALEEWNGDLWWYDTPSTGLGEVHVFQIAWVLRLRMASLIFAGLPQDVIFRAGGRTRHGEMQCRILLRL